ncbi:MAG: peroxiredoxin [Candidatus Micrarchaeales archaeon]|nr:peroxiredoxin [Candidatus Micrarchaeales archaeon]
MQSMLEIGEAAPEIAARTWNPETKNIEEFKLSEHRGRWEILIFYPGDFTFVCATDIEAFAASYPEFIKNGAEIYAISTDSIYSHKVWSETSPRVKESKIPLIEDFNKKASEVYGFLNKGSGAARRGTVIIDPEGRVQYIAVHSDALGKDAEHIFTSFMGLKYVHDTPAEKGHMCAIPANWKAGRKALEIDLVNDIGKL